MKIEIDTVAADEAKDAAEAKAAAEIKEAAQAKAAAKPVNGHGKWKYDDGAEYDGEWKGGERHGGGKMGFANGHTYEGDWSGN